LVSTAISSLALGDVHADPALNWTGAIDHNWFNAGNWEWDTGAIPTATREARVDKPGVTISAASATANNLLVGLSANADLTINSSLTTTTSTLGWNTGWTGTVSLLGSGVTWANSGALSLGNAGIGILSIGNQASVTAGDTYIGAGYGGSGRIDLSGGAHFTSSGTLFVGYAGVGGASQPAASGVLNVTSGSVSDVNGIIADGVGSTGTATIDGASSSWTNNALLTVGGGGVGTLTISGGGSATSATSVIGSQSGASGSSVTLTGDGSSWTNSGQIIVGNSGNSTLNILAGGDMTSGATFVGRHSTSTAKVNGAGSTWTTGSLALGGDSADPGVAGNGTLLVTNGGSVSSSLAKLGLNNGDSGTATITGSGSDWNINGVLSVGFNGTGTLTATDSARFETTWGLIGHNASSNGSVTISNGALWTDSGYLYVGNEGTGTLTISGGGKVVSGQGYVGTTGTSTGTATVTGTGSSWDMSGALFVGQSSGSHGTMTISDGGKASGYQGIVGDLTGSTGSLTVTGAGSSFASVVTSGQAYSGDINAGRFGTGTITVSNGGAITGNRFYAGNEAGSSGTVLVTGAGSSITTTNQFVVGSEGAGTATVSDSGTINASIVKIAALAGSTGTVNIGAAEGSSAQAAGRLEAASITFGNGTGTLVFNHTGTDYSLSSNISGAGAIKVLSGATTLSGNNSAFTGLTTVSGGTLDVTGTLGGGATAVRLEGGTLTNGGTIKGSTTSVFFATGGNTLNILPISAFDGVVNYNNQTGNTTTFGAGSYSIGSSNYNDVANTIKLNNSRQTVVLDNANTTGTINVVAIPAASQAATQYTASVSDVIGSILSLDVARPDQVVVGDSTISALQYGETKPETSEAKALRTLGDGVAVDQYGNLFWARTFGGLRYQPSNDGDPSSHTSHYGLLSGVDHQFDNYRLGFFGGAGNVRGVVDDGSATTTGVTGFLGVYGAMKLDGLQWNASITGGGIDNRTSRSINNGAYDASGDFMGWYISPEVSVSKAYQIAPEWELTPSFKARYTGAFYDGYSESGQSSQNLTYDSRQSHSVDGRLQIELKRKMTLGSGLPAAISASASVVDTQYMGSNTTHANLNNNEFSILSSSDRNVIGASLGVGFDAMVSERASVYGGIDGTIYSDDSLAASGRLGLKLAF